VSSQSLFSLKDEVAVVTGGAQGLGEQMAIGLAEAGAHVVIADLNLDSAKKVAQSLEKYGAKTMAVHVDVTQKPLVENMVDEIVKKFQKIDILVTSAGVGQWVPAVDMPESDWKRVMDINLNGTFFLLSISWQKND
jgi:NAD(P)-dependent dehydrogenase (short-subunit alcohol dehydrogenase family)